MNDYILKMLNEDLLLLCFYIVIFLVIISIILEKLFNTDKENKKSDSSILKDILVFMGMVWLVEFFSDLSDSLDYENENKELESDLDFDDE